MKSSRPASLAPRLSSAPRIEVQEAGGVPGVFASYVWRNLAITVWFSAPDMEGVATFEQRSKAFCAKHPEGFSSVHIMVPGGRAMPSSEVRAELSRIIGECAAHVAAGAALIAGNGFWASALRSMVTALSLLTPRSLAPHIYADVGPLAQWLAPLHSERTGISIQPSDVERALRAVQRTLTA